VVGVHDGHGEIVAGGMVAVAEALVGGGELLVLVQPSKAASAK
jgi:hypothetical protein